MSWTIDDHSPEEPELLDAYLLSVGKALSLASGFEEKCKHPLGVCKWGQDDEVGRDVEVAWELYRKVLKQQQGPAIKHIGKAPNFQSGELAMLLAAKDARNYIAHEGAKLGSLSAVQSKDILELFAKLEPRVLDVARGENLVSHWCFEIEDQELHFRHPDDQAEYLGLVLEWVFEGTSRQSDGSWAYKHIRRKLQAKMPGSSSSIAHPNKPDRNRQAGDA